MADDIPFDKNFDLRPGLVEEVRPGLRRIMCNNLRCCRTCRCWPISCRATRRAWFGVRAPKGTPTAVIEKLNREINIALADPR